MGEIHGFVLDANEKRAKFSSLNQQVFHFTEKGKIFFFFFFCN